MLTAKTSEPELMQGWFDSDPEHTRVRVTFPINKWAGSADSAAVYFEIEPGNRLAEHTDSAEEILYVVAGDAEARSATSAGASPPATSQSSPRWSRMPSSTSAR
jgi:hypothetical protein